MTCEWASDRCVDVCLLRGADQALFILPSVCCCCCCNAALSLGRPSPTHVDAYRWYVVSALWLQMCCTVGLRIVGHIFNTPTGSDISNTGSKILICLTPFFFWMQCFSQVASLLSVVTEGCWVGVGVGGGWGMGVVQLLKSQVHEASKGDE